MAELSRRLSAIAAFVSAGIPVADIGCDHAQLLIDLCATEKTPHGIAVDINEGPLSMAKENIERAGLSDRIETRLSDGFAAIRPGEVRSAVIAGMGGHLICRILRGAGELLPALNEVILGPQSDVDLVRNTAGAMGLMITNEEMIREDGKYYTIIRMVPGMQLPMTRTEELFGPQLLTRRNEVLHSFLLYQQEVQREILAEMDRAGVDADTTRRGEVEAYLGQIGEALRFYH